VTRKIAAGRGWSFGIYLFLFVGAVVSGVQSYRWNGSFLQWIDDVPMQVAIDSQNALECWTPYRQTCEISHGAYLVIDHPIEPKEYDDEAEKFRQLKALSIF